MRTWKVLCGALVAISLSLHFASALDNSPTLIRLKTSDGMLIVGELQAAEGQDIVVLDLVTGKESRHTKTTLQSFHEITEQRAIYDAGFGPICAWKVQKAVRQTPVKGKVSEVAAAGVYVTIGAENGITEGQILHVLGDEVAITDPDSGEVIAKRTPRLAKLEVKDVRPNYSIASLVGDLEVDLRKGQVVESVPPNGHVAVLPIVETKGVPRAQTERLTLEIQRALVALGVPTVERKNLDKALVELAFQQTRLFEASHAQKIGKQIGAMGVLIATTFPDGKLVKVAARLVKVATGEIITTFEGHINPSTTVQSGQAPLSESRPNAKAPDKPNENRPADSKAQTENGPVKVVDLPTITDRQSPKTFDVPIPKNAAKVEVAFFSQQNDKATLDAGNEASLMLNGKHVVKYEKTYTGPENRRYRVFVNAVSGDEINTRKLVAEWLDVTPRIKPGEINVFKFSHADKTPRGFRVRITTRDE